MMDNLKALRYLKQAQEGYDKIVDKEIHYVYFKNNAYHELVLKATKSNFMHLCGVSYYDNKTGRKKTASEFYKSLKRNRISKHEIRFKSDGTTELKLNVLPLLSELSTCRVRIIDNTITMLNNTVDSGIRSKKQHFILGLVYTDENTYSPKSFLNLKTFNTKNIKRGFDVHCIYENQGSNYHVIDKTDEFLEYESKKSYMYTVQN